MKEFTLEEVSHCNGTDGKPIYVVYQGKVIDVSTSKLWEGGQHMNRHHAGKNLTSDIQAAPHTPEVLERYPQVGVIKEHEQATQRPMPEILSRLLKQFPMLRRHPHPMTVHFPIVFMFSVTIFNLLYLITSIRSFEITALHCLGAGILFSPVAILTGVFTWWLNYFAKPMRPITIKIPLAIILWFISVILFIWRITSPDVLSFTGSASFLYFVLVLSLIPIITIIGWFGAALTFPVEKE